MAPVCNARAVVVAAAAVKDVAAVVAAADNVLRGVKPPLTAEKWATQHNIAAFGRRKEAKEEEEKSYWTDGHERCGHAAGVSC